MSDVFKGQAVRRRLRTRRDLTGATNFRIYYTKPDKTTGFWSANVDGQDIYYDIPASVNDQAGFWKFQAYFEMAGKPYYGTISTKEFLPPII